MKPHCQSPRHHQVLSSLCCMPEKIIALYDKNHVSEFVLHELCNSQCLNMTKAAYFIDNPDFDCLQGVAGYNNAEHKSSEFSSHDEFEQHLSDCSFNNKVRSMCHKSQKKCSELEPSFIKELASDLGIKNPLWHTWKLKHDNHGIIIYEMPEKDAQELLQEVHDGLHLFGFCSLQ